MRTKMLTDRLELRLPTETDRDAFVDLFCRDNFMVFSAEGLTPTDASGRFDRMLDAASTLSFAKQPVRVRSSGLIVGYCGVGRIEFEGQQRLEFGYRLVPEARGLGYATEAGSAILNLATQSFDGEVLAMIKPNNAASQRVAEKLRFEFWKMATVDRCFYQIHRLQIVQPRRSE